MSYKKKTSHVEEGVANLTSQFKDKPKIVALVSIYLRQIQDVENAASDLLTETNLDNATGIHLDNIGVIVGESRTGRSDLQYRTAIRARILLNTSNGTMEDVIALAISVAGAPVTITVTEFFPAGFVAHINEPIDPAVTDIDKIASFIASGRPSGVQGFLTFSIATPTFAYDGAAGTGYDEGKYGGAASA